MLRVLKVAGDSLAPEYQQGDFVLVSKIPFLFIPPSPGTVIAFRQPGYGLLIKRIENISSDGGVNVIGTHPDSIDSRVFGTVRRGDIIGKVIWHIRKA
jgi:phage repressor protein C with HTH and peptisase S24 domain